MSRDMNKNVLSFRAKSRNPDELPASTLAVTSQDSSTALGLTRDYGCSTRLIMASSNRTRSTSNCSGSEIAATRIGAPKIARNVANGRGTTKRSQLFIRQQLEYSIWIGTIGAPLFCACKI